jgi:hypothetical protein
MANRETFPASPIKISALLTFSNPDGPEETTAKVTVTGLSWITIQSVVTLAFAGVTGDHESPDDAQVEGLTLCVGNLVPGSGFDILGYAPNGTWGTYQVTAIVMA